MSEQFGRWAPRLTFGGLAVLLILAGAPTGESAVATNIVAGVAWAVILTGLALWLAHGIMASKALTVALTSIALFGIAILTLAAIVSAVSSG